MKLTVTLSERAVADPALGRNSATPGRAAWSKPSRPVRRPWPRAALKRESRGAPFDVVDAAAFGEELGASHGEEQEPVQEPVGSLGRGEEADHFLGRDMADD